MKKVLENEAKQISAGGVYVVYCPQCGAAFSDTYNDFLNSLTFGLNRLMAKINATALQNQHVVSVGQKSPSFVG